jgi:predicted nucleotidyltransferase
MFNIPDYAKFIFVVVSGSHAYGFNTPDSDHDYRFVYYQSVERYIELGHSGNTLNLSNARDDIQGWDIRKFLALLLDSNAQTFEWLQSPIVTRQPSYFPLYNLAKHLVRYDRLQYNYAGLCKLLPSNCKDALHYLRNAGSFYCARAHKIPPVLVTDLFEYLPAELVKYFEVLCERKSLPEDCQKLLTKLGTEIANTKIVKEAFDTEAALRLVNQYLKDLLL